MGFCRCICKCREGTDCDTDPYVYFGAAELGPLTGCMRDFDNDGYGDANPSSIYIAASISMIVMYIHLMALQKKKMKKPV